MSVFSCVCSQKIPGVSYCLWTHRESRDGGTSALRVVIVSIIGVPIIEDVELPGFHEVGYRFGGIARV